MVKPDPNRLEYKFKFAHRLKQVDSLKIKKLILPVLLPPQVVQTDHPPIGDYCSEIEQ